ncbi:stage II sporulation protein M [Paraclostridium bifermentans]
MRRINRRTTLDKISKDMIIISSLFILFVILGSLLNKIFPQYTEVISNNITYTNSYYDSGMKIKEVLMSNFKMDLSLLAGMSICTLSIILAPIALIIFAVKGLSIGYTINTFIIAMKASSFKMLCVTLIKFSVVLPGMIILALISLKYFEEFIKNVRKQNKTNCTYLMKRYIINSFLIIMISVSAQTILNAISTITLKIF